METASDDTTGYKSWQNAKKSDGVELARSLANTETTSSSGGKRADGKRFLEAVKSGDEVTARSLLNDQAVKNGIPVMVAMELNPTTRKNLTIDAIKIACAYGKTGIQHLIDTSDIYYINPNKKRTDTWLTHNQLQLPLGQTKYGSIKKIPQNFYSVNNKSITESQNYSYAITDNSNNSHSHASATALSEGAKRLNATGIVKNIDNSDGFMSLETVRTEDGKYVDKPGFGS